MLRKVKYPEQTFRQVGSNNSISVAFLRCVLRMSGVLQ